MAENNLESQAKTLLTKMRFELGQGLRDKYPSRSARFDEGFVADILENRQLSLAARALLLWGLTRKDGFVVDHSLAAAVGADAVAVYAATLELQVGGYLNRVKPDRSEFSVTPPSVRMKAQSDV